MGSDVLRVTAVIVTVDDAHLGRVGEVAASLRELGLVVEQVLDEVGVITGQLPPGRPLAARSGERSDRRTAP